MLLALAALCAVVGILRRRSFRVPVILCALSCALSFTDAVVGHAPSIVEGAARADTKLGTNTGPMKVGTLSVSAPTGPMPVTYQGQALGGFSASAYVSGTATIAWAPGETLWLELQLLGQTNSTTGVIVGSADPGTYTHGWFLLRGGPAATPPGSIYVNNGAGTTTSINVAVPNLGISTIALVWRAADNHVLATVNGSLQIDLGALAPVTACGGTCTTYVGAGYVGTGTYPGTDVRVLALATWASEATAAQTEALTFPAAGQNRLHLQSAVRSGAVVDLQFDRDWNGIASTITTLGSSPIALAVTGSPTLTHADETRMPLKSYMYGDGKFAVPMVDSNGYKWTARNPYAHVRVQTSATYLTAETYTTETWQAPYTSVASFVGGTYNQTILLNEGNSYPIYGASVPSLATFTPGAGTAKVVDLWEGSNDCADWQLQDPYGPWGSYMQALWVPVYLLDGATPSTSSILAPLAAPTHRVVLLGDGPTTDWLLPYNVPLAEYSIPGLLRHAYPYPTDGITVDSAASLAMVEFASRAVNLSSLVAELDGTSTNAVWISLGTIDFENRATPTLSQFQTAYQAAVNGICAGKPGTALWLQSPVQRISPASETYGPYTLTQFRSVISGIATSTCPAACTCTYVECGAAACVSNANVDPTSGIYLTQAGLAQLEGVIVTNLTGAGQL
jgi:hypothetical protein